VIPADPSPYSQKHICLLGRKLNERVSTFCPPCRVLFVTFQSIPESKSLHKSIHCKMRIGAGGGTSAQGLWEMKIVGLVGDRYITQACDQHQKIYERFRFCSGGQLCAF